MNTEKQYHGSYRGAGESMLSPKRPPHTKKKGPNPMLLRVLRAMILVVGGLILALGLVISILPLFRVSLVEAEGNSYYTVEQLMQAAGIEEGDEIFGVDLNAALNGIFKNCPYVEKCSIAISSPVSLKISVTEKTDVMYTEHNGSYISFEYVAKDASFRVLEKGVEKAALKPFLLVELPAIVSCDVGKKIRFEKTNTDVSYMKTLVDALEKKGMLSSIVSVDLSSINNLSFVTESGCTVKLGTLDELDRKLTKVEELLLQRPDATVVNVQNPNSPTVQPAESGTPEE